MEKIFIAAHYNLNNGDRAVLEATVQKLLSINAETDITVSAFKPSVLKDERFTTVTWPLKDGKISLLIFKILAKTHNIHLMKYIYKAIVDRRYLDSLSKASTVVISGGHHLTDILGDYTYYSLALNYLIPIYMNKKVVLLPQSIGPFNDKNINRKRALLKFIMNNINAIAIRDESSKINLNKFDIDNNVEKVPDIVFGMEGYNKNKSLTSIKNIGIALYCNYSGNEGIKKLEHSMSELEKTIKHFLDLDFNVNIIPMETKNSHLDDRVYAEKIISNLKKNHGCNTTNINILESEDSSIVGTIKRFSEQDLIIAYKTHSVVFSLINHIPVIAVAYHQKSIEFMEAVGLKEYAIMDMDVTSSKLIGLVHKAIENSEEVINKEVEGVNKNREILDMFLSKNL